MNKMWIAWFSEIQKAAPFWQGYLTQSTLQVRIIFLPFKLLLRPFKRYFCLNNDFYRQFKYWSGNLSTNIPSNPPRNSLISDYDLPYWPVRTGWSWSAQNLSREIFNTKLILSGGQGSRTHRLIPPWIFLHETKARKRVRK